MLQNLKIAIRILLKNPLFILTAVTTIALGIGASTAIFGVTNAVLLHPLPYKDSDRLVIAGMELRQHHVRDLPVSNADFIDLRDGTRQASEDFAGVFTFHQVLPREDRTPEQVRLAIATTNFFRLTAGKSPSAAISTKKMECHSLPLSRGHRRRPSTHLPALIRAAIASVASDQPISNRTFNGTFTLNEAIEHDAQYSRQRLFSILFGIFSAMALALALVGIFSVVAYSVAQRTTEFGVRLALGAPRTHVLWVAARIALVSAAAGIVIGLAFDSFLSAVLAHWLQSAQRRPGSDS